MTAFFTAAGGDRRRMPASVPASTVVVRAVRRSPRVGPPPLPASSSSLSSPPGLSAPVGPGRPVILQVPPPPPPVRRDPQRRTILWTPELMDWLYQCRESGFAVTVLACTLGCTTQTVFSRFHSDPRGVPGMQRVIHQARVTPRDFARWGRGRAEDMPADVLAREVGKGRSYPPVGPLTRLLPRQPVGRRLDLSPEWDGEAEGEDGPGG